MNIKLKDLANYNIFPKKKLGQNFIFDLNICNKIAKTLAPLDGFTVIEIGPGPGCLSRSLLGYNPKRLILIEKDTAFKKLLKGMEKDFSNSDISLIFEDFLETDLKKFSHNPLKIYSNLPYYISTEILMKILPLDTHNIKEVTFTFQKELADRIFAAPKTKSYSRLSVLCQYACNVNKVFNIPARVFYPVPKVDSTVIKFSPNINFNKKTFSKLQFLTKVAFSKRRKMLRNSLSNFPNLLESLENEKINTGVRAEDLTVEQFARLSNKINF